MQIVSEWNNDGLAGESNSMPAEEYQRPAPQKRRQAPFLLGNGRAGFGRKGRGGCEVLHFMESEGRPF